MTDEDRAESASPGDQPGSDATLPAHASAYFSPRPPPAMTQHRTIETEAVQFDPAIDPDLAETRRMQPRESEPPTWPDVERPVADAPTVLVPVVRARRTRRRLVAGLLAAVIGGAGGVIFGLAGDPPAAVPPQPATPAVAAPSPVSPPAPDTAASPAPEPAPPAEPPVRTSVSAAPQPSPRKQGQPAHFPATGVPSVPKATPKTSAWIKPEPPRPWIQ